MARVTEMDNLQYLADAVAGDPEKAERWARFFRKGSMQRFVVETAGREPDLFAREDEFDEVEFCEFIYGCMRSGEPFF